MNKREKFNIRSKNKPVVLVAPLDWGLGHATRCIPVINHLIKHGCEVIIATEGKQEVLLKQEFQHLKCVHLAGYQVKYSNKSWKTIIKIFLQIPKILRAIAREHRWLRGFLKETNVSAVISDNRYGLFNSRVPSIFITHQLLIRTSAGGLADRLLQVLNYRYINRFTACWIPDFPGEQNLAGLLSHPAHLPEVPLKYLGVLTRFQFAAATPTCNKVLILLSGPEPQRSIFERMLLTQLEDDNLPAVLVRGLPGESRAVPGNFKKLVIYNHLPSGSLRAVIESAGIVICRPGYSSVMDMMGLHKKFIFVATPGQAEQEYLGAYLASKNLCINFPQKGFLLKEAMARLNQAHLDYFKPTSANDAEKIVAEFAEDLQVKSAVRAG